MGFWDVLLFNIAAVLGPRWIALAALNGPSSLSLWVLAAGLFFVPTALVVTELSTRYPHEGGLYVWSKEAFGEFHGFVAGWSYWAYSVFYFPGLLMASVSMSAYVGGGTAAHLANNRHFLIIGSLLLLAVAVVLNIVGLNIGKWLQNAGGVGTYVPLMVLVVVACAIALRYGSATQFTWANVMPHMIIPGKTLPFALDLDRVNFWASIAFAFTGLELVSTMSEEIRNPQKTLPRAILGSGVLIALIYMLGTAAVLMLLPMHVIDPKSGVFQAISHGSGLLGLGFVGVIAALLVTAGNAGGVGTTVAGVSRVPFVVGIDRYLPEAFGRIHPRWRTPYVAILVQAAASGIILLVFNINESTAGAYQVLVDAAIILYFLPFLYMYAAVIKLGYRAERQATPHAVLIPGGKPGVWAAGLLGGLVTLGSIVLAMIPPAGVHNKFLFDVKLIGSTFLAILLGLVLYWRGARQKRAF